MIPLDNSAPIRGESRSRAVGDLGKRLCDVVLAMIGLILLSPFFALIALRIKLDTPGPVFFRGKRSARGGGTFDIVKFRTMYERPTSYKGPRVTAHDDQRITPLGRWLRDTKLNELPQLWNVLKGDMSLVGPRPEDPAIASIWPDHIRREILLVRPGITSPASILYRNEEARLSREDVMDTYIKSIAPSKLRLDLLYVRHRSFCLDMNVILWTLVLLLPRLRSFQPPEEHIFWGPVSRPVLRHLSWFSIDMLITCASLGVLALLGWSSGWFHVPWHVVLVMALVMATVFSIVSALLGLSHIDWSKALAADALGLVPGLVASGMVAWGVNQAWGGIAVEVMWLALALAGSGYIGARYRGRLITGLALRWFRLRKRGTGIQERVLIVGAGTAGQFAAWMLVRGPAFSTFHVVGFIDDDPSKRRLRIGGVKVVGGRENIPQLVKQHDVGIIVFAIHNISLAERKALLDICCQTTARVVPMPDFVGTLEATRVHTSNSRGKPQAVAATASIPHVQR